MIGRLLPAAALTVEAGEDDWTAPLCAAEEALVARAVKKRHREFTAGRACARRALERLGFAPGPILAGAQREPLWPPGVIGSITHCAGYCAAAVARAADLGAIGIDAEQWVRLEDGVASLVCTLDERRWVCSMPGDHWPRLIFSAKESIYKAWYPVMRRWLDYQEAELMVDVPNRRFTARILSETVGFPARLEGRFALGDKRVFTAVTLPCTESAKLWGAELPCM